jgi:hypothetical protein
MSTEARVAEAVSHQPGPQVGDSRLEQRPGHGVREAVPGEGGDDDVEGIVGSAAVRRGVGQQRQQLEMLDEGARKAVSEHDRERVGPLASLVHEVHADAVQVGAVVREPVEPPLLRTPIELGPVRQ